MNHATKQLTVLVTTMRYVLVCFARRTACIAT